LTSQTDERPDDLSAGALRKAFDTEARTGMLLAMAALALLSIMAAAYFFIAELRGIQSLLKYFSRLLVVREMEDDFAFTVFGLCGLLFSFIALRTSKRPEFWFGLLIAAGLLLLTQINFDWVAPPPEVATGPRYLMIRYQGIGTFAVVVALSAFSLSRRLVRAAGLCAVVLWGGSVAVSLQIYASHTFYWGPMGPGIGEAGLRAVEDMETLLPDYIVIQLVFILLLTHFVVMSIDASRRFVVARVRAESSFAFLARFFPPAIVDRIEKGGGRIPSARRRAAIVFIDFEGASEDIDLSSLHALYISVETISFRHGGVNDRFTGGPIMLAFGAVEADEAAAGNALACALEVVRSQATARAAVHFGEVISGEFSGAHSRAFSVIGDVVNTTRRILEFAEASRARLMVSNDLLDAAPEASRPQDLTKLPPATLRGRVSPIDLWSVNP